MELNIARVERQQRRFTRNDVLWGVAIGGLAVAGVGQIIKGCSELALIYIRNNQSKSRRQDVQGTKGVTTQQTPETNRVDDIGIIDNSGASDR